MARQLRHPKSLLVLPQPPETAEILQLAKDEQSKDTPTELPQSQDALSPLLPPTPEQPGPDPTQEVTALEDTPQRKDTAEIWIDRRPPFVTPEHILALIREPAIKVVSFAIFDTLLVLPALNPKDIFHILAQKVNTVYNVDFLKLRWNAEDELGQQNATLQQIYDGIAKRHKMDAATVQALMEEEIHCERTLLSARPDVEMLYKEAVRLGKRVIAVADMYLPSYVLTDILQAKGCPVDAVYVSCDHKASKNDGTLYDIMLGTEGVAPASILHVGSNHHSDYVQAMYKYICAIWLPSIRELAFPNDNVRDILCSNALNRAPLWSIFLGHALNRLYGRMAEAPDHIGEMLDMRHVAELVLGPVVTALGIGKATGNYDYCDPKFCSLCNASLPHKACATVGKYLTNAIAAPKTAESICEGVPLATKHNFSKAISTIQEFISSEIDIESNDPSCYILSVLCASSEISATNTVQQADITTLHAMSLEYTWSFCTTLGEYIPYVGQCNPKAGMDVLRAFLSDTYYNNMEIFSNINVFDSNNTQKDDSLAKAIEYKQHFSTVFSQTGFDNPHNIYVPHIQLRGTLKIGIHVHLYYPDLAYEFIRYLQDFPTPFDLYVTITDTAFASTAQQLFSSALLLQAQHVRIITVPNRGRDVAPWVLNMRPYQANYDLFCHIHSKKSAHMSFGNDLRTYLLNNLLLPEIAREIISFFEQDSSLGCLFPTINPHWRLLLTMFDITLYDSKEAYTLACDMLHRMGFKGELRRSELFFSCGSMLWYRPKALHQLFTCDLRLEEFAEEPIGTEGTLAHAIERLPTIVAMRNGYMARYFTPAYEELTEKRNDN